MTLSPRETQVLALIGYGLTAGEIAAAIGCERRTVEAHKQRLFGKLGARNAAHAVALFHCMAKGAP